MRKVHENCQGEQRQQGKERRLAVRTDLIMVVVANGVSEAHEYLGIWEWVSVSSLHMLSGIELQSDGGRVGESSESEESIWHGGRLEGEAGVSSPSTQLP